MTHRGAPYRGTCVRDRSLILLLAGLLLPSLAQVSEAPSVESRLISRWVEATPDIRGWATRCEPYENRTLARVFPHTTFYLLIAEEEEVFDAVVAYGCECMGEVLLMPDEINLLSILENRTVNRHNVQTLAEIIVRMADPEGATTMNVFSKRTNRDPQTGRMTDVVLESRSYISGMEKRWTFDLRFDRFYSVEEKLIRFRPPLGHGPELDGPVSGHEHYVVFWRSPEERKRMREVRRAWLEERHPEKAP